ncbi:hypothetical protein IAQ61_003490 [Plenodomus lingam]|uniref:Spindle pole body component n=1 Tax=Leptosphaeria maculans (strain JN3 / isolate v23.1.3 / race Av1-4-5-6-7-8) TaxID=985895 RepID=E5AEP4_LEPMJ|nr:similar to gamma-tubulin complex component GCP5 [Plenodomus lingam JN3]KAH9876025.1 hypothetical protein IAQ61_003490 [Plenodomus lingam]CBY01683.1 similar to gamma-tubulin complex component GCP5 [Plenodomus lingam JN3]
MSHNAKFSSLTDELIQSILKFDPASNRQAYKHAKDIASRGLRGHQYARTNQFEVTARFAGLDEKFRIRSRDDLADALQTRLQKLEGLTSKFKPDYLSLLLLLADRPLENTQVEALELLRPPSPPPVLTWSEILEADPYSDEEIWKDIDDADDSSADEKTPNRREKTPSTPATSVDEDDTYDPEACIIADKHEFVTELRNLQFWNNTANEDGVKNDITELQIIRETLFMLAGLRTSLYQTDAHHHNIRINTTYVLSHAMPATTEHLLSQFTEIGKKILGMRKWTEKPSVTPLNQTFESAVRKRLLIYEKALSQLQQRYLLPDKPISVSLLELHDEIRSMSTPILCLAQIVSDVEPRLLVNPFSHLEALFDYTTLAQVMLERDVFNYMSEIFFECLQTYLKPIRRWMEDGELGVDDETFFVFANDNNSDPASLWHDRYMLRHDGQDKLRSPTFLQPAAKKIFNTGKSVVFLQKLGIQETHAQNFNNEPLLDHRTVCGTSTDVPLSPFPELFQAAFEKWIRSKYSVASNILRQHIFEAGALMRTMVNFEFLYFGRDGSIFEDFANAVFGRMDAGRRGWNDRYVLTGLARGTFSTVMPTTDVERVVVRSSKIKERSCSVKALAAISIDFALPWSIQNIIQRSSIPIYQQLFTFILQIYRVQYVLRRARPTRLQMLNRTRSPLACKMHHRLIWFTDILRSYLAETVIFFTRRDMNTAMDKSEDIDEMSQIHIIFVARLQERALLSKAVKAIHKAVMDTLELGMLFASAVKEDITTDKTDAKTKGKPRKLERRKSAIPIRLVEDDSDSDAGKDGDELGTPRKEKSREKLSPVEMLEKIDGDFARLLPFITAGLRSVGRVGAEPMWEQLAERLEWEGKNDGL